MSSGRRYDIHEAIGKGAFGTVYRAMLVGEGGFKKEVAIKVLNERAATTEGIAERLRDEARLLGRVRHRAILEVDGLVFLDGRWALVTEFVQGCSLLDALRVGRMPLGAALEVVSEIASALHVAYHTTSPEGKPLHLVHRDIKPANVQITAAGEVKLLDFGIAQADFDARESITQAMVLGTPAYMSPERFGGRTGPESDIYALALVLCEVLSAKRVGKTSIYAEQHQQHVAKALQESLAADPAFAVVLPLCEHMLAFEPSARPTAREVAASLHTARGALPGPWLPDWADTNVPKIMRRSGVQVDGNTLCGRSLRERAPIPTLRPTPSTEVRPVEVAAPSSGPAEKPVYLTGSGRSPPSGVLFASLVGALLLLGTVGGVGVSSSGRASQVVAEAAPQPTQQAVQTAQSAAPIPAAVERLPEVPPPVDGGAAPAVPDVTPTLRAKVHRSSATRDETNAQASLEDGQAGHLISAKEYASWLESHPDWQPEPAHNEGPGEGSFLWSGAAPEGPAVAVSYAAAEALCQPRGGLASAAVEPTSWRDTSGRTQEWRVLDGKPALLRSDGTTSTAVRRANRSTSTGFRCAR